MDLNYWLPTRVFSGTGCVRAGGDVFASLGKRCLLVTGGNSARQSGALSDCTAVLEEQGIAYEIFDRIGPNPLVSSCEAAGRAASAFGAEFLVGIGGGSPLDAVKAAAIFAANPELHGQDIFGKLPPHALPVVAIGTTAGTGSEVTRFSVLTVDETGRKQSFNHPLGLTYARYSFCDPAYTASMPYDITISTALDALCHTLEGYFSAAANDITDGFAIRAAELLLPALIRLQEQPQAPISAEDREAICYGAIYAGLTINMTGTLFCHSLGYYLSESCNVPHGQACAAYLPLFLARAAQYLPEKAAAMWARVQMTGEQVAKLVAALTTGIPKTLEENMLQTLAKRYEGTVNFMRAPGGFTQAEALQLLQTRFAAQ